MFKWEKLGKVFDPTVAKPQPWMQEYAQCPSPLVTGEKTVRVYFACRPQRGDDLQYISHSGYVDLSRKDLTEVVNISRNPILKLGGPGSFDEFGSMTSSFVKKADLIYAYFTGWTRMQSVPYTLAIGMAVSTDGGDHFNKIGDGPILGPTVKEPYLASGPIVRIVDGHWHMWYLTGIKWVLDQGQYAPVYRIVHATSHDGMTWVRNGSPVVPTLSQDECQVSFALFFLGELWHVIFAYRQSIDFRHNHDRSYRLGYAYSVDLTNWTRDDAQIGLDVSESGWDSEMICYPQIFELDDRILMFYCGNKFGREGFGIAEIIDYIR